MFHVLMINFLMIMEKAVCTLGLISLQDQKIKSNNYHFLYVGRLINILGLFLLQHLNWIEKIQYHENRTFLFCLSIYVFRRRKNGLLKPFIPEYYYPGLARSKCQTA